MADMRWMEAMQSQNVASYVQRYPMSAIEAAQL